MMHRRPRQFGFRGFTIMELMVSIALVSLLLFLINSVFNQTQQAISRGSAVSELIGASRATSEQFTTDAKQMLLFEDVERVGEPVGFLVIVQQQIPQADGPRFPTPQQHNQPQSDWTRQAMRSDQIAFFRGADRLDSLTPGSDTRFDSDAQAAMARVWYGHVTRPMPTGASAGWSTPGQGANELVTDLILGRQALLIVDEADTDSWPDPTDSIYADATTAGDGFDITTPVYQLEVPNLSNDPLWYGATDVMIVDPALIFDATSSVYEAETDSTTGQPNADYKASALSWAYVAAGDQRLVADPNVDVIDPVNLSGDVGQTHAVFIPYVSDFVVEFAADITDDLTYDPLTGLYSDTPGDGLPDNTPDTYDVDVDGTIYKAVKWYTTVSPNPADSSGVPADVNRQDEPVTWPIPSGSTLHSNVTEYPPLMTSTTSPALPGWVDPNVSAAFVFGHTGDDPSTPWVAGDEANNGYEGQGKWWPYMIRIRYRLHNRTGDFSSVDLITGQSVSGKWFEQIIPIPR